MHIPARPLALSTVALASLLGACGGSASPPAPPKQAAAAPMVVVPQLIGRHQDDAHRIVARAGLQLRFTGFTGKYGNGRYNISCVKVLRQSPAAGERRPRGASISVIEAACRTPKERPHGVAPDGSTEG